VSDWDLSPFADEQDAHATDSNVDSQPRRADLGGLPIPVQPDAGFVDLGTFDPRFSIGDPSMDSDKYLSVWNQSNWTGGGQIEDLNEASDINRFWWGTADARFPRMLTLPPETLHYTDATGNGDFYPIGDYDVGGTVLFWGAFGDELRYWDKANLEFTGGDTLAAEPVAKGVVYDDELWIPYGASGYETWDGVTLTAAASHTGGSAITPVSFVEWDDKLLALETDGQVSIWDGSAWTSPAGYKLKGNRTPRHLVVWWNPERQPTVYVITSRDVWALDPISEVMYRTGLRFPVHPDHGRGAAAWRDDSLYVSTGVGGHQLSLGGVVSPWGLDRDYGLPGEFRGVIVDLEPEYNGLLALVQGLGSVTIGADEQSEPIMEETMLFDGGMVVPVASAQARSTLQRWTGTGWHTVWASPGATGLPTRVMVSEADGEYRLWWGYGEAAYTQILRRGFHNPKQGARLGIDRFEQSAFLLTGRFDANMAMFKKLASHVEINLDPDGSAGTLEIRYRTDRTYPDWETLGTVSGTGFKVLPFGVDDQGFSRGLTFRWIEFGYYLASTSALETPIVNWISLKFLKVPLHNKSWTLNVPIFRTEEWNGVGPRQLADHLSDLASSEEFYTLKDQDTVNRVRVAQVMGSNRTGKDFSGMRRVSIIGMPLPESEGTDG